MHACMHAYVRTCVRTYVHVHAYVRTYIHATFSQATLPVEPSDRSRRWIRLGRRLLLQFRLTWVVLFGYPSQNI